VTLIHSNFEKRDFVHAVLRLNEITFGAY